MSEPAPNSLGTAELVIQQSDCASDLNVGNALDEKFPAVFATTRMIALLEIASARVLKPFLQSGEMSVGVAVDIIHSAATRKKIFDVSPWQFAFRETIGSGAGRRGIFFSCTHFRRFDASHATGPGTRTVYLLWTG